MSNADELRTRLGTYLLAAGSVGELGPVLLLTLFLSAQGTVHNALILLAFVAVAVGVALLTLRVSSGRCHCSTGRSSTVPSWRCAGRSCWSSRWLGSAYRLGLDLLLGGFAAGMITRQLLRNYEVPVFESKPAVAFGVFVPFFFVVSGMRLDVRALFASPGAVAKIVLFFFLFLVFPIVGLRIAKRAQQQPSAAGPEAVSDAAPATKAAR